MVGVFCWIVLNQLAAIPSKQASSSCVVQAMDGRAAIEMQRGYIYRENEEEREKGETYRICAIIWSWDVQRKKREVEQQKKKKQEGEGRQKHVERWAAAAPTCCKSKSSSSSVECRFQPAMSVNGR